MVAAIVRIALDVFRVALTLAEIAFVLAVLAFIGYAMLVGVPMG